MEIESTFFVPGSNQKPVFTVDSLADITLETFLDNFLRFPREWIWWHASSKDVIAYAKHIITTLSSEKEIIEARQKLFQAMLRNPELVEFLLLRQKEEETIFLTTHGYGFGFFSKDLQAYLEYLDALAKILLETKDASLEPFRKYVQAEHESEKIKDAHDFLVLFRKPFTVKCYLGYAPGDDVSHRCEQHAREYPQAKEDKKEWFLKTGSFELYAPVYEVCIDATSRIDIRTVPYMSKWNTQNHYWDHLSNKFFMGLFGVSLEKLLLELVPKTNEPIMLTLNFTEGEGGYMVTGSIEDVDGVLDREGGHRGPPKYFVRSRNEKEQNKTPRSELQLSLFGKEKSMWAPRESPFYGEIRGSKETFFRKFFDEYKENPGHLGRVLVELRYLALVADSFKGASRLTPIVFPKVCSKEENVTMIKAMKNPSLFFELKDARKDLIANDVSIDNQNRVHIITGPNRNGKTRYMDGVGLSQIIMQAGWPIFAESAEMSPKTSINAHVVHSGVGVEGESRFSHECERMRKLFESLTTYPMVFIDEAYTGTNWIDGQKLLEELLSVAGEFEVSLFLATHYHGLIDFVEKVPNGKNLHCVVGQDGLFTYKIKQGSSTFSNALQVAEEAGARGFQLRRILEKLMSVKQ